MVVKKLKRLNMYENIRVLIGPQLPFAVSASDWRSWADPPT
jgi:hypothetical protein